MLEIFMFGMIVFEDMWYVEKPGLVYDNDSNV